MVEWMDVFGMNEWIKWKTLEIEKEAMDSKLDSIFWTDKKLSYGIIDEN